jgi:hypothetical protein
MVWLADFGRQADYVVLLYGVGRTSSGHRRDSDNNSQRQVCFTTTDSRNDLFLGLDTENTSVRGKEPTLQHQI